MITLRPLQDDMVDAIRASYKRHKRSPLLVAPTGFGKTVLFSFMARAHVDKGGRVLVLVHREELLDQVSQTLDAFSVSHGFIAAQRYAYGNYPVRVASVFTLLRRMDGMEWSPTLIIVDEAHHATRATSWGKVLAHFPKARVLGVTATPIRLSGEGLGDMFDDLVIGPTTQKLIDERYLSGFRVFCPSQPDLSAVHKRTGDFAIKELEGVLDRPSITGDAVSHYRRHAWQRQGVAFCVSVEHAKHVADQFMAAGVTAKSVDGSMPKDWRRGIIKDFRERRIKILTSCDLVSEGFDVPGIECGISLRPTMSKGLWLQQFGRCLRICEGKKEAIILDHAGNALRHGLPTDEHGWSLEGTRGQKKESTAAGVKICKKCYAANTSMARVCVECGTVFEARPREVSGREGELEEMTPEKLESLRKRQAVGSAKDLESLVALGKMRGYKDAERWAAYVLNGRKLKKERKTNL